MTKTSKGQGLALDLIAAFFILSLLLLAFASTWNSLIIHSGESMEAEEQRAYFASDMLLESPGLPANWSEENVERIGIVDSRLEIDEQKLRQAVEMNYTLMRRSLNLERGDVYINVSYLNGTLVIANGTNASIGLPPLNATHIIKVERLALFNNERVKMNLLFWEGE
ncbi:MAG: hypothetical protein ABIH99_01870 [Candidatus Micrarchaeota archaeon]